MSRNTFIKAAGHEIGQSLYEESMLDIAKDLLSEGKIILPKKVITSLSFEGKGVEEKILNLIKEKGKANKKEISKEEAEKILKEAHKHDHDHVEEKKSMNLVMKNKNCIVYTLQLDKKDQQN